MNKIVLSALTLAAFAGAAHAGNPPTIEWRIVQLGTTNTMTQINQGAAPTQVNLAVQARVVGGSGFIGDFGINVRALGEADNKGQLQLLRISNPANTGFPDFEPIYPSYWTGAAATSGFTGMQYAYRALIASVPTSNGVINGDFGSIVHSPMNTEILGISGRLQGSFLVEATDQNLDGIPDNATMGNNAGSTAVVDPSIAQNYFGANGTWASIYRFRYTVNDTNMIRDVNFNVEFTARAGVANQLLNSLGVWGVVTTAVDSTQSGYTIKIIPTPASVALLGMGGLLVARRRRA